MGRLTLITGGAASGKSLHAVRLATSYGDRILFVATCVALDAEMQAKVAQHRAERPAAWTTVEVQQHVAHALTPGFAGAVVDCLTLLISQMLVAGASDAEMLAEVRSLAEAARRADYPTVIVTNEVGMSIVPDNPLARRFRETAGRANKLVASLADDVELMVCGIPLKVKHAG